MAEAGAKGGVPARAPDEAEPSAAAAARVVEHSAIERVLSHGEDAQNAQPGPEPAATLRSPALGPGIGLGVGTVLTVTARRAVVAIEGAQYEAALGSHVDAGFLELAVQTGELVLLQQNAGGALTVLGVVQGRHPTKLAGERVEITAETEVVVRSGRSALRLRQDGVVDLIGARISASSRGLLRLVGRALRLN